MAETTFLPLGQHRLDPSPDFDPIRSLLHALWVDLFWVVERIAEVGAAQGHDTAEARRELGYLRGDTDDALQSLGRLIELLLDGYAADPAKRIARGSAPPYFRDGESMAAHTIPALGQDRLDPPPGVDPVRFFLEAGKKYLLGVEDHRTAYERLQGCDPVGAEEAVRCLQRAGADAQDYLRRLVELLLAGHAIDPSRRGSANGDLRLFRRLSEADWLACPSVWSLCQMLRPLDYGCTIRFSERKWRLFGVACVSRVKHVFNDPRTRALVGAVEQRADGLLAVEDLKRLWKAALKPLNPDAGDTEHCPPEQRAARYAFQALVTIPFGWLDERRACHSAECVRAAADQAESEEQAQVALLREVFGNPFRPASIDPAWLAWNGRAVSKVAQAIYDGRAFDRLPILADALEEAGCTDADMLNHCRQPGEHVRGCWVVDLLLGEE